MISIARTVFIMSSPRSGSTWLAKIFDSHPDTLYLHEPDISDRGTDVLPHWFHIAPTEEEQHAAQRYLERLMLVRTPRATGIRPFFRKSYRPAALEKLREMVIYSAKAGERLGGGSLAERIRIPDLILGDGPKTLVLKSVSALCRADAIISKRSDLVPVLLLRHPCGYVTSMLRGRKSGLMPGKAGLDSLLQTRSAAALDIDSQKIEGASEIERLAWTWLLQNVEAEPAVVKNGGIVLSYDDLTSDPAGRIRDLFERLSLGWPKETADFVVRSAEHDGEYYSVYRDPVTAANRWRTEMDKDAVARVRSIVSRHPIGATFFAS